MKPGSLIFLICALLLFSGCATGGRHSFVPLMKNRGDYVHITNRAGDLTVRYVSSHVREYVFDGTVHAVALRERPEAFQGRTGLYNPAATIAGIPSGVRMVVDESRIDYPTVELALKKIYEGSAILDPVYTDDGLVVRFGRSPNRNQINVEVVQLTIAGRTPDALPGSRASLISGALGGRAILAGRY